MSKLTAEESALASRFEVKTNAESHFSWLRTRMSVERTLMSWVRTGTALIGFGFTIVQFFERLGGFEGVDPATRPHLARYVGLLLIGLGVAGVLVSILQYRRMVDYLKRGFEPLAGIDRITGHGPLLAIAMALVMIGIFAFFAVLTRAL